MRENKLMQRLGNKKLKLYLFIWVFFIAWVGFSVGLVALGYKYKLIGESLVRFIFESVWAVTTSSLAMILIAVVGFAKFQDYLEIRKWYKKMKDVCELWHGEGAQSNKYIICYGGSVGNYRDDIPTKSSIATANSIYYMQSQFRKIFGIDKDVPLYSLTDENERLEPINNENIILLGGNISAPNVEEMWKVCNFQFYQVVSENNTKRGIKIGGPADVVKYTKKKAQNGNGKEEELNTITAEDYIEKDYALLTIAVEESGRRLYWFCGNFGLATYGSVVYATTYREKFKIKCPDKGKYIQYVVKIYNISNDRINPEHPDIDVVEDSGMRTIPKEFRIQQLINGEIVA